MDTKPIEQCPSNPRYTLQGIKPFINYRNTLNQSTSKQFRKRSIKYVHQADQIRPPWRESALIKQIKQLKLIHEINNYSDSCLKNSHILKAFKPLQKHVKRIMTRKDRILAHFPYVSRYQLRAEDPLSWKIFLSCRKVKMLQVHWEPRVKENFDINKIKKFRIRFSRAFHNSKSLKHLKLYLQKVFNDPEFENFTLMFSRIIPSLRRLETFCIKDIDAVTGPLRHENRSFVQILNHVTHFQPAINYLDFQCWHPLNCNSYFAINTLKNLVDLSLDDRCLFITDSDHLRNLTYIKKLDNLKTLHLDLEKYKFTEFFNYFTLPKSIESITLGLHGFEWDCRGFQHSKNIDAYFEKNRRYQAFFDQWRRLDRLTDLTLIVESREDYASKFVAFIIKRLRSLETLSYEHISSEDNSRYSRSQRRFVSLKDVWKALEGSRLTIQEVFISSQYVSLAQINSTSFEMPKLTSLSIESEGLHSNQDVFEFLTKLSSLNRQGSMLSVNIQGVIIRSEKDFSFFDSIKEVSENTELNLEVLVKERKPEIFTKSLCNLLSQNILQGSLYVIVPEKSVYSMENLGKLEQTALGNTSLKHFKMMAPEGLTYFEVKDGSLVYDYENSQYATLHLYYNN